MRTRVFLVHPYLPSMEPIQAAFRRDWPEARTFNLVDQSLYAEMDEAGTVTPEMVRRIRLLFEYCVSARADGIVFTGSTFGPAVDEARRGLSVPVVKPDEAMAEAAVASGDRIAVLCTARRALPVVMGGIEAAAAKAGRRVQIEPVWVEGAQKALADGNVDEHNRLIGEAAAQNRNCDVLLIAQISMAPAVPFIADVPGRTVVASPEACLAMTRALLLA